MSAFDHVVEADARKTKEELISELETLRQREVMDLVVAGKSSKEIALQLCISRKTVDNHRIKLMKKMQVANVVQLIIVVGSLFQSEWNPLTL